MNVEDVVKLALKKKNGKTLSSPAKAASLVFVSTILGVLAFQQLNGLFIGEAAPVQACLGMMTIVAAIISLLSYVAGAFIGTDNGSEDSVHEKLALFGAAMTASMHYLGNSISSFQLIELEVEEYGTVSKETLVTISLLLANTKYHLKCLSALESPTAQEIYKYIREDLSNPNST